MIKQSIQDDIKDGFKKTIAKNLTLGIYDRIETAPLHRRKGLATIVLKKLEDLAMSRAKTKGLLVATQAGKVLYEALGWKLYSAYTSIVIPEPGY
ncbi:GNAT family N-acetyltransferase [Chitinophaga sp. YIM B06452]|uniref:GNAT family N-acetyltransferase n=1 Tax=Chitinophaga sp. YIM B06452 TaxID=3082158 RepID=UPI0031FE476B